MAFELLAALVGAVVGAAISVFSSWLLFWRESARRRVDLKRAEIGQLLNDLLTMTDVVGRAGTVDEARAAAFRATMHLRQIEVGHSKEVIDVLEHWWVDVHESYLAAAGWEEPDEPRMRIDLARLTSSRAAAKLTHWYAHRMPVTDFLLSADDWRVKYPSILY